MSRSFEELLADKEIANELREIAASPRGVLRGQRELGVSSTQLERALEGRGKGGLESLEVGGLGGSGHLEAIVRRRGRPSLLVRDGRFATPDSRTWQRRLEPYRPTLDATLSSVGRVEVLDHDDFEWIGTAWVIAERTVLTNRHVAMEFAERRNNGFRFAKNQFGRKMGASVDFVAEHDSPAQHEVGIKRIRFIEADDGPDVAVIELTSDAQLPEPIVLYDGKLEARQHVAVVGYPARDSRNELSAMLRIFGDIYGVKRFAPGWVTEVPRRAPYFTHDCSTLGGNSGSVVLDVESGEAVGLHYAGRFSRANFAVDVAAIKTALTASKVGVSTLERGRRRRPSSGKDRVRPIAQLKDREGYDERFLGSAAKHRVPLPALGRWKSDVAKRKGARGADAHIVPFTHFSVIVCKSRNLPLLTAVNIDGSESRRIPRGGDTWWIDPRLSADVQTGNAAYYRNDLDRGHMVRRLDPVWGTKAMAKRANEDSFHYINSCPQHKNLNQKSWVGLESYILDESKARGLRVSVFTGPVFADDDPPYRGIVRLPQEFWKVAIVVDHTTGNLSATGYLLSQKSMIDDLREFAFGAYQTHQVPLATITQRTGLRLTRLEKHDPLSRQESFSTHIIRGPSDLQF